MKPTYSKDCGCSNISKIGHTDLIYIECKSANEAMNKYIEFYIGAMNGGIRYYCIHGPGGHLIGVKDTPYGNLPITYGKEESKD